jgi:hypothetical protein
MMSLGTPRHRRPSRNRTSKSSVHGSAAGHDWVRPDAGQGGGGCEARRKPCPFLVLAHVRVCMCKCGQVRVRLAVHWCGNKYHQIGGRLERPGTSGALAVQEGLVETRHAVAIPT